MKKYLFILLIALAASQLFGQYQAESQFSFEDTGMKPEKKVPMRQGSFEVIQGRQVSAPIDMGRFQRAAMVGINALQSSYQITIHEEGTGYIFFRARRVPAWVDIRLCYWEDEYWFEYWDSYRFEAIPATNRIHKNYRGFIIKTIERQIKAAYRRG